MKKFSLQRKIDLAFALASVLFLSLCYAIFSSAAAVRQNRDIILDTHNINTVLEKILTHTVSIEAEGRGYTITGSENFLDFYTNGNAQLDAWLDSLRSMSSDERAQQYKIDSLDRLLEKKMEITGLIVEARRRKGKDSAEEIVATQQGKIMMDSIRQFVQRYQTQQLNLLAEKLSEVDENVRMRDTLFVVLLILGGALGIFAYFGIRKSSLATVRSEQIQRKLSHKMAQQNRQLNDFANITSHNLRSPASNIASLVDIVREESTVEEYRTVFEMLRKVSVNLNDTLNELIEVLHIKKNTSIQKEELSFDAVFGQVRDTLQGQILERNARLTADFSGAPTVRFPKLYLESILQNLLSNALKYSSPDRPPLVEVSTERKGAFIYLYVCDNGLGIDLGKYGHKVFGMHQIFHRNDDAKGIGLFMTKTQIEALGGRISVNSDGHSGCTFTVQFPA